MKWDGRVPIRSLHDVEPTPPWVWSWIGRFVTTFIYLSFFLSGAFAAFVLVALLLLR